MDDNKPKNNLLENPIYSADFLFDWKITFYVFFNLKR